MKQSINRRAKKGVKWSAIEKFGTHAVQFALTIILARLLEPSDYGLIAMVLVVVNIFSVINETGLGASLIQKIDRDELDFSSVFILNLLLGVFLYSIIFLISPYIASFFNEQKLTELIRVLATTLMINSFAIIHTTKLIINIDFKTQAKASFPALFISGIVGVYLAYIGFGVWALVAQMISFSLINVLAIWFLVKWRPLLNFSPSRVKPLIKFAYKLMLARLINTIFNQVYTAVIGKEFLSSQLGYYNRAQSIKNMSSGNITALIQRVSTPLLCELQNNKKAMGDLLLKFIVSTSLLVFPLLFGIFVLSEPLIIFLLSEKWLSAAPILKLLCPVGILFVINTFNLNIFNATGRTDLALNNEMYKKILFVFIIVISISHGFMVLIASQILIGFIELLFNSYYTKKQIGISLYQQLWALKGVFSASLIMALSVSFLTSFLSSYILKLVFGFVTGFIIYVLICWIFKIKYFRQNINLIFKKF